MRGIVNAPKTKRPPRRSASSPRNSTERLSYLLAGKVNGSKSVTRTGTGFPSLRPGWNVHCFAALIASASKPYLVSSDCVMFVSPTVPSSSTTAVI